MSESKKEFRRGTSASLVQRTAEKLPFHFQDVQTVCNALFETLVEEFVETGHINVKNFATFSIRARKDRVKGWLPYSHIKFSDKVKTRVDNLCNDPDFMEYVIEKCKRADAASKKNAEYWLKKKYLNFRKRVAEYRDHYEKLLKEKGIDVDLADLEKQAEDFIPADLKATIGHLLQPDHSESGS